MTTPERAAQFSGAEAERCEVLSRERGERERHYAVRRSDRLLGFWARLWAWLRDW
ncbi:MAG TPA: hypothetical protein VOA80_13025 [Thermoanaerobaculia bacterium]|nr:hypothetical protein [Thermoanaerobaculia bacterium]